MYVLYINISILWVRINYKSIKITQVADGFVQDTVHSIIIKHEFNLILY